MKFQLSITAFICMVVLECNSQDIFRLFYNDGWELTSKDNFIYIREAEIDLDRLYFNGSVRDFKNDTLIMEGQYSNNKRNGLFKLFYNNGRLMSVGKYRNDLRDSLWTYFYPNGQIAQKITFNGYDFVVNEFYNKKGKPLIANGSGKWEHVYFTEYILNYFGKESIKKEHIKVEGKFKNYQKDGKWTLTSLEDDKIVQSLDYRNGILKDEPPVIQSQFPDDSSEKHEISSTFQIDTLVFKSEIRYYETDRFLSLLTGKEVKIKYQKAGYPYGDVELFEFIAKHIRYPRQSFENKIEGKVFVKVVIDMEGNKKELSIYKGQTAELNNEALRVLGLIPRWLPAMNNGVAYETSIVIPIAFKVDAK
jgi:TonB family protein